MTQQIDTERLTMNQLTEEQQKRLAEVRENRRIWHGNMGQTTRDIDFLLSLVDSKAAGGDAERLAVAIESAAAKAGIIEAGQHALTGPQLSMLCDDLATTAERSATAMRDACVDELNALLAEYEEEQRERTEDAGSAHRIVRAAILAMHRAIGRVRSLTLDTVNHKEQS